MIDRKKVAELEGVTEAAAEPEPEAKATVVPERVAAPAPPRPRPRPSTVPGVTFHGAGAVVSVPALPIDGHRGSGTRRID